MTREPKKKLCRAKACNVRFVPTRPMQKVCSPACGIAYAREQREARKRKQDRERKRETRARREALKTTSDLTKEAQAAFNAWVRERDYEDPCISCGAHNPPKTRGGEWDCGHYRSTGANPELRFEPLNAHKQCKKCNSWLSGNVANYRIGLVQKIGPAAVDWLEGSHPQKRYRKPELTETRDYYRAEARRLKRERERRAA